jgi:acetyltransferase EpsM
VVADIARLSGEFQVVGHIDDVDPHRKGQVFGGAVVLGDQCSLAKLHAAGTRTMAIGIGDCATRLRLATIATNQGFALATLVHPSAVIAQDVTVGIGTVIAATAVVNPGSTVGKLVIINTSASVDHECVIGDGAHIGPGANLGGRVIVGSGAWVGIGASVKDKVRIGAGAVVGAGSVVVRDIPDGVVAYGCPARVRRKTETNQFI